MQALWVALVADSYTAFTLEPFSGTLTGGTLRVYGYKIYSFITGENEGEDGINKTNLNKKQFYF